MTDTENTTTNVNPGQAQRVTAALECPACGSRSLASLEQEVRQQYTGGLVEHADGRVDALDWGEFLTWGDRITVGVACRECLWWHDDADDPHGPLTRAPVATPLRADTEGK